MKVILSVLLALLVTGSVAANEIDDLKTFDDVNRFLKQRVLPKDFETVILDQSKATTSNAYGKHKFYKLDLDREDQAIIDKSLEMVELDIYP
jgi:hypothetical protein